MTRLCKDWLEVYKSWTYPRCEAPETYILWSGLFALASVVKRHVSIPKDKMLGSWEAYPNIYVGFIGPPATRKTTTMDFADILLSEVPNINEAADSMTAQVLSKNIADSHDTSISIRSGELGTFINPSGSVMVDLLVSLFDGRRKFSTNTIMRGLEFAQAPSVNFIFATTPVWIANNLNDLMVGGGLTSRTMLIYEEDLRRKQLFYEELDYEYLEKLHRNLVSDLVHISTLAGEFRFTQDAKEFSEEWYRSIKPPADYRLAGYFGRRHVHMFKVAMLLRLCYSDELLLTLSDIRKAIAMLEVVERKLPLAYHSVGKNPYTTEMDALLDYIKQKERVSQIELLSRFYPLAAPAIILELLGALMSMGKIAVDPTNRDYIYPQRKIINPTNSVISAGEP